MLFTNETKILVYCFDDLLPHTFSVPNLLQHVRFFSLCESFFFLYCVRHLYWYKYDFYIQKYSFGKYLNIIHVEKWAKQGTKSFADDKIFR